MTNQSGGVIILVYQRENPMTYQQLQENLNNINHKIQTKNLTREDQRILILLRETINYNFHNSN